jgi:hypothetical protein
MPEKHWKSVGESRFPWEREALDFILEGFPAQDNYLARALFELVADDGSINEVDTLVVCPHGAFLIEIKSRPGTVGATKPPGPGNTKGSGIPRTIRLSL